tara:strand:- start:127 stop:657 length:531 start_codon:yes stop_codon:yes gene_type:complete
MKESDLTEEDIEALPKYTYIEAAIADRSRGKLKEGVDSFLLYNRATDEYQLIKGNTNITPSVSSKVIDQIDQTVKKTTTALNPTDFEKVEARPTGPKNLKRFEWDKKYKNIYTPEGTLIVVPPRPPEGETTRGGGRSSVKINPYKQWNDKYEKTHDPKTGIPFIAIPKNLDDLNKG